MAKRQEIEKAHTSLCTKSYKHEYGKNPASLCVKHSMRQTYYPTDSLFSNKRETGLHM